MTAPHTVSRDDHSAVRKYRRVACVHDRDGGRDFASKPSSPCEVALPDISYGVPAQPDGGCGGNATAPDRTLVPFGNHPQRPSSRWRAANCSAIHSVAGRLRQLLPEPLSRARNVDAGASREEDRRTVLVPGRAARMTHWMRFGIVVVATLVVSGCDGGTIGTIRIGSRELECHWRRYGVRTL